MDSSDSRLVMHHVGGRCGVRALPDVSAFERDFVDFYYDADADCLEQIEDVFRHTDSEVHVLPYCLADVVGKRQFNINQDPFTSSLLEYNKEYGDFYLVHGDHDYIIGEAFRTANRRELDVVTLDHLLSDDDAIVIPPDFLSLDTQGSESDILTGAQKTLRERVVALVVEVEFHPLYVDQKLFGDVANQLDGLGFHFAKFVNLMEFSPARHPVGLRGDGFQVCGDALFLKKISEVECTAQFSSEQAVDSIFRTYLGLRKLAFFSIVFNQFEYALEALRHSRAIASRTTVSGLESCGWNRFLTRLESAVKGTPQSFLPTFSQKYTFQESCDRFAASKESTANVEPNPVMRLIRDGLKRIPFARPMTVLCREMMRLALNSIRNTRTQLRLRHLRESAGTLNSCPVTDASSMVNGLWSPVEEVLFEFGFEEQAQQLMANRIKHTDLSSAARRKAA